MVAHQGERSVLLLNDLAQSTGDFRQRQWSDPHMAWYAYCISEKQAFPELARHRKPVPMQALTGISGNQIFLYPASDLAVIVSEHNPQENLDQQAAVDHARVIG